MVGFRFASTHPTLTHATLAAQRWKQGKAALLRSPELEHALAWQQQAQPTEQWAERYGQDFTLVMDFLERSEEEQHKEAKAIQKRRRVTFASLVGYRCYFNDFFSGSNECSQKKSHNRIS